MRDKDLGLTENETRERERERERTRERSRRENDTTEREREKETTERGRESDQYSLRDGVRLAGGCEKSEERTPQVDSVHTRGREEGDDPDKDSRQRRAARATSKR